MQRRNPNPIQARKDAVRKYSRNAVVYAGGGIVGGVALGLIFSSWTLLVLGLVVAVVGGVVNYNKVQKIVNHKDNY
ncbi:putative secreted protein [Corynebacterium pilosum]|uniref:Putative secreted protein n=2 Tax=Corynebacterium pilosum TaxID=35756 RepID=A0A376CJ48_9CORY|nr:putative secreted protein [Corynebacterium pilosum]